MVKLRCAHVFLALLFLLALARADGGAEKTMDKIHAPHRLHMRNIRMIHLSHDGRAQSLRYKDVPQLQCVGGKAWYDSYRIANAVCVQQNGNWTCNAETAPGYTVRDVRVVCEGYDGPEDEYVVDGSCNMQYSLDHADDSFGEHVGWFGAKILMGIVGGCCGTAGVVFVIALSVSFVKRKIRTRHKKYMPDASSTRNLYV